MYVYLGKLKWFDYGVDETFTIILPNGPVRVGDTAYLFFQWTKDAKGVKKANWFQTRLVEKVTKTPEGDDVFTLNNSYYTYEITAKNNYSKLSVTMGNPGKNKSTMSFERIWQPEGAQSTDSARIWTGKINWLDYAQNEETIFIVPQGFGDGKPIISIWQWTKSSSNKEKDPQPRFMTQKVLSSNDNEVKVSFESYYKFTATWNKKTEKLAVQMAESGKPQDLGEYTLAALSEQHSQ